MEYGLHTLVKKDPGAEGIVDIVAIHGLNGHYENTWTTKKGDGTPVNWLRDLLPKQIQDARIMSFSYNSRVQFSKSTSDIFVFADELLEQLLAVRSTSREKARRMIFICHSLGGIVFKQALNRAHENDRYSSTILAHVAGVAFFGTPHRGSGLAHWGGMLSSILKAGSLAIHTNSKLAKDLERDSRVLENISRSFVNRGKKLIIVSFYETEKMDKMNCRVVETDSATLGWPGEICIGIDGNHRSMCWFTEDEPRFRPVWKEIEQMAFPKNIYAEQLKRRMTPSQIMFQLNTCDYQAHKERNVTAVYGTCTWILDDVRYQSWLTEIDSFLLWISADAGCGKSVLTSFLVDHHKRESASQSNICYFFFKADSNQQGNALHALSALLHQLYKCQPELITIAIDFLAEEDQNLRSLATLWKLLTGSVEAPHTRPTICFIDGLDECEENTRKLFIKLITNYFTMSNEDENNKKGAKKRLKLLVTSRPDNSIKNAFDRRQTRLEPTEQDQTKKKAIRKPRFAMMRLRGEDETEAISNDIELVIKHAIGDLEYRGLPVDLLEEMERELISRADRTFLWVTLIIQLLEERFEEGASRRELDAILRSRGVDAIYAVLLNSKANHLKARRMLNIILAALEPLTVEELSIALAVKPDHQTFEQSKQPRRPSHMTFSDVERDLAYPFENHIKGLCGHFIRIIHQKVYLVHQSAREFLLNQAFRTDGMDEESLGLDKDIPGLDEDMWLFDEDTMENRSGPYPQQQFAGEKSTVMKSPDFAWQHTFSLIDAHAVLLEICVTYLYLLGKKSPKSGVVIGTPGPEVSAFLKYAATSWAKHFLRVCDRIEQHDLPYYHGLCHPQFPGFQSWVSTSRTLLPTLQGFIDDELQDYLVHKLRLYPGDNGHRRDAEILRRGDFMMLSSNPTSQNLRFPVTADDTGFVSLDFDKTREMFGSV